MSIKRNILYFVIIYYIKRKKSLNSRRKIITDIKTKTNELEDQKIGIKFNEMVYIL